MNETKIAWFYAPVGGFQFIFILFGLFDKDKSIKFHAIQALTYYILISIAAIFTIGWLETTFEYEVALLVFITYFFVFWLIIPVLFTYHTYTGGTVMLPVFGKFWDSFLRKAEVLENQIKENPRRKI